jgi:hypothetical protein
MARLTALDKTALAYWQRARLIIGELHTLRSSIKAMTA